MVSFYFHQAPFLFSLSKKMIFLHKLQVDLKLNWARKDKVLALNGCESLGPKNICHVPHTAHTLEVARLPLLVMPKGSQTARVDSEVWRWAAVTCSKF